MFAYEKINSQESTRNKYEILLTKLEKLEDYLDCKPKNLGWQIQRIHIAIELGWKFDHIVKTTMNPLDLSSYIDSLQDRADMFSEMDQTNIFNDTSTDISSLGKWERANRGFNYFWPKNTQRITLTIL